MGMRPARVATAIATLALVTGAADARGDGVCVTVDLHRDNLAASEQAAVRIAILDALSREKVAIDRDGRGCTAHLSAYSVRLGQGVTTTLVAGDQRVQGRAANLDEVDLLVRQLVRSLVTGRALATGTGVTDRDNVLRDQTAPRRADGRSGRIWTPVVAVGGGMLQLPAAGGQPRHRQYDVVVLESRLWGVSGGHNAFEVMGRVVLHDYAVLGTAYDAYRDERDRDRTSRATAGRTMGLIFSPLAVPNWELGMGLVSFLGARTPRPYLRLGVTAGLLSRFSDPEHRFDLGLGAYAGLGVQLTRRASLSISASFTNPVVHDLLDTGYWYFLTTAAMLEFHGAPRARTRSPGFGPEPPAPPPTRRIVE